MKRIAKSIIGLLAILGLLLAVGLAACGSEETGADDNDGSAGATGANGAAGAAGAGADSEFEQCLASVEPLCRTPEKDTADKLEIPCMSLEFLPIPLTDGSAYGPVTLPPGPYGGQIEWNEGAGTEFVTQVNGSEAICNPIGIDFFAEPAAVTDDLKNTRDMDQSLYTIFRPACMKEGEKYPVITWANGTCGYTHGYAPLLGTVASHGFVIIASNSTWTATPPTNTVQLRALDYAEALNADPNSIYYQRLDLDKIGAMGHSQGSGATAAAASDPRIKAIIMWNKGTSNAKPFLNVSGERDMNDAGPGALESATNAATQPGAWLYFHQVLVTGGNFTGHLTLMEQPERVWEVAVAWWKYMLHGDEEAKKMFVGDDCGLCNSPAEYSYGRNSLLN
jgi:hypothetical protein